MKRKGIPVGSWEALAADRAAWRTAIRGPSVCDVKRRYQEKWETVPKLLIGEIVEMKFGGKRFEEAVMNHDVDIETNGNIWRVLYDDGDEADYNAVQTKGILCVTQRMLLWK
jgi:hypothetical protein